MKKLIAMILTLAVLCSFGASAMAAGTDVKEYTWEEVAQDTLDIDKDAVFHQIGTYCIWLPSFYVEQELSAERIEQGYIANIVAADRSSAVMAFTDTNEEKAGLDALAKAYTGAGFDAEVVKVNGVPAMLYTDETSDTINCLYLEGEDTTLTFSFYPYSDKDFSALAYFMVSSLQPGLLWTTVEEAAAKVDKNAQFVDVGGCGLYMWLPSIFEFSELTEEDIENGYAAYLTTPDESADVEIFTWGEDYDLNSLMEFYTENDYEDPQIFMINGIRAVMASDKENDTIVVDYPLDTGKVLEFAFWPASDEGYNELCYLMVSSLQPAA